MCECAWSVLRKRRKLRLEVSDAYDVLHTCIVYGEGRGCLPSSMKSARFIYLVMLHAFFFVVECTLAARLVHQPRFADDNVVRECLAHVVDAKRCDTRAS